MTTKEFFKSNAFKSLAVLIAIVLVAGALLAVFNDLLYISEEERLNRTLSSIYGKEVTAETVELTDEEKQTAYGTVDAVYHIVDDGNYLFQTTGTGGYSGGTVTLWTVVACTGTREEGNLTLTGIEKVVYGSNSGQTLMANFSDSYYSYFSEHDELVAEGGYFTAIKGSKDDLNQVSTGATMTSTAISNAVNAALSCFRTVFMTAAEGTTPPPDSVLNDIFGEAVATQEITLSEQEKSTEYGTVDSVYYVPDRSMYLFKTTGTGGFSDGTVTVWRALTCTGTREDGDLTLTGIEKVVYDSNVNQSWMNKIPQSFFDNFAAKDELVAEGGYFTAMKDSEDDLNNVTTGATGASNASCNAVNTALCCFRTVLTGGEA